MTRRPRMYGGDSMSYPLWLRLTVTAPFAFLAGLLGIALFLAAANGSPGGALATFLLGGLLLAGIPLMRAVWRPSVSWRHQRQRNASISRHAQALLDSDSAAIPRDAHRP